MPPCPAWPKRAACPLWARGTAILFWKCRQPAPAGALGRWCFNCSLPGCPPTFCHPERTWPAGSDWSWLERLVESGCLVQVTAMSLTGEFGSQARDAANRLLEMGCCHLVASDAHSDGWHAPVLSGARDHLRHLMGAEAARLLLEESPRLVLEGREPEAPRLAARKRRRFRRRG